MSKEVIAVYIIMAVIVVFFAGAGISAENTKAEEVPATKFVDCFEPMPIIGGLNEDCWGAVDVGPRDQDNGLEDRNLESYTYWDGGIIKGDDGRFYMFGSRWPERLVLMRIREFSGRITMMAQGIMFFHSAYARTILYTKRVTVMPYVFRMCIKA